MRATFVQSLDVTGGVLLFSEVDDKDSETMEWKSVPGDSALFAGWYCVNCVFVLGDGFVLLGTFGTVVLVVELDDREPLQSIIEGKFVIGVAASSCDA